MMRRRPRPGQPAGASTGLHRLHHDMDRVIVVGRDTHHPKARQSEQSRSVVHARGLFCRLRENNQHVEATSLTYSGHPAQVRRAAYAVPRRLQGEPRVRKSPPALSPPKQPRQSATLRQEPLSRTRRGCKLIGDKVPVPRQSTTKG